MIILVAPGVWLSPENIFRATCSFITMSFTLQIVCAYISLWKVQFAPKTIVLFATASSMVNYHVLQYITSYNSQFAPPTFLVFRSTLLITCWHLKPVDLLVQLSPLPSPPILSHQSPLETSACLTTTLDVSPPRYMSHKLSRRRWRTGTGVETCLDNILRFPGATQTLWWLFRMRFVSVVVHTVPWCFRQGLKSH